MVIVDVQLRQLSGWLEHEREFWQERVSMPLDIYPEYRKKGRAELRPTENGKMAVKSVFVEILTDDGILGRGGPVSLDVAWIIHRRFRELLIGENPMAIERLWDIMYRSATHGHKGESMIAISAIDCALWDLKGNALGVPVYTLLGGPTRSAIPVYASALGYSIDPDNAHKVSSQLAEDGYAGVKWFPRMGPVDGNPGIRKNLELAETIRDAVGPDVDIMFDAWMTWNERYTLQMAELLCDIGLRWIEEPVMPDMVQEQGRIRAQSLIPIAGGEHEYTRWGMAHLIEAGACDVLQPDPYWAGGITELQKIFALASVHGIPVIPHGHSMHANLHLVASQPELMSPVMEYLVKWNQVHQFFLQDKVIPVNGQVLLKDKSGFGMDINTAVIAQDQILKFNL